MGLSGVLRTVSVRTGPKDGFHLIEGLGAGRVAAPGHGRTPTRSCCGSSNDPNVM